MEAGTIGALLSVLLTTGPDCPPADLSECLRSPTYKEPSLIVHVVDERQSALPGADVVVVPYVKTAAVRKRQTDREGAARFYGLTGDYAVEASLPGFKPRRLKKLRVSLGIAVITLRLTFDYSRVTRTE